MRQVPVSLRETFRCVMADEYLLQIVFMVEETAARREAKQLCVSQSRSTETVEETAARREADRLRTSRARAKETAEAAARREENQRQTAAARNGEGLDPADIVGDFTHNCRNIRPRALIVPLRLFLMMGCCPYNSPCSYHVRLDYERIFILS